MRRADLWPPDKQKVSTTYFSNFSGFPVGSPANCRGSAGRAGGLDLGRKDRPADLGNRWNTFAIGVHTGLSAVIDRDTWRNQATGTVAKVWELPTGRELLAFAGHRWPVGAVAVSPDGRLLVTGLRTLRRIDDPPEPVDAKLWNAETGRAIATLEVADWPSAASSFEFSPDGRLLVMKGARGRGLVWDVTTNPPRNRDDMIAVTESTFGRTVCLYSHEGPWFASNGHGWFVAGSDQGRTICVADDATETPRPLALPHLLGVETHKAANQHPVFGPGGRTIAVPVSADMPRYMPGPRGLLDRILRHPMSTEVRSVVRLYDPTTGRDLGTLPDVAGEYHVLAFTPDGQTFWTERLMRNQTRFFEQWPVPPMGVPWWLIGVSSTATVIVVADCCRLRRRGREATP